MCIVVDGFAVLQKRLNLSSLTAGGHGVSVRARVGMVRACNTTSVEVNGRNGDVESLVVSQERL